MKATIGIGDASSYDTNMLTDWEVAKKQGCEFGIVRAATTGPWVNVKPSLIQDSMYSVNMERMQENGIHAMSYAWFDPRTRYIPAIDQAVNFIDICKKYGGPGSLGPLIDLEDTSNIYGFIGIGKHIKLWLDQVERAFQVKPRIYTNAAYIQAYLFNNSVREEWLLDYGLVIANWNVTAPTIPQPWAPGTWDCWQYRANAPGKYYGFYSQYGSTYAAPNICLAVWNGQLP